MASNGRSCHSAEDVSVDLATGMRIGRYQLLFRLGKGGMGEVWAARQASGVALGFRKIVALKVLRSREITSNAALMFLDEAKAASVLHHPAIVQTVDLGRDGDLLFIAMDLVQGPSLTALLQRLVIDRARVPPALVAYVGSRLASALDYAHDRALYQGQPLNLVHRDVSPHNILIDVHSGEVRLTDFGVARTSIQDHESRVGTVRGKPSYMAPEQVVGGAIDRRTDVFALGIVLYESACLKRLFGRQNPIKSMDAVIKHNPKPLTEIVDGFPDPLWQVICKALNKDTSERWASAADMHEALADVSRELQIDTNPSHRLIQLVRSHFDLSVFDLEARLGELETHSGLVADPTAAAAIELDPQANPAVPTVIHWPSDDAADPLAPEAIEAVRTRYQPTPASVPALMAPTMAATDARALSIASGSMSASLPRRRRMSGPALLLAVAAIMLAASVGWLAARPAPAPTPIPPSPPPPTPVARAQARPVTTPEITQRAEAGSKPPAQTPDVPDKAAVRPTPPPSKKSRRRARAAKTQAKAPSRAKPASYEEVHRLLHRVKELDDMRGTAMIVTLVEAGRDNTEALARLQRQAREFLRSRGRAK